MSKNLFSFIMPAYKSSFLKEAISSILAQTCPEFELIIVDDASPEDLGGIVSLFKDDRIKYMRNESNVGGKNLVAQWNRCIELAKNDYVILASDDDLYDKDFLLHIADLIQKYPLVNVFHSRVQVVNYESRVFDFSAACVEWESCSEFIWHRVCKQRAQYIPEFVFRRVALMEKGGFVDFPSAWGSDHATSFLLARDQGVVCCNLPLFKWRQSGLNISSSGNYVHNKIEGLFQYHKWLRQFVSELEDSFYKELLDSGLEKYLDKRLVALLSQYTFPFLMGKLLNPFFRSRRFGKKYVLYGVVFKMKNMISSL